MSLQLEPLQNDNVFITQVISGSRFSSLTTGTCENHSGRIAFSINHKMKMNGEGTIEMDYSLNAMNPQSIPTAIVELNIEFSKHINEVIKTLESLKDPEFALEQILSAFDRNDYAEALRLWACCPSMCMFHNGKQLGVLLVLSQQFRSFVELEQSENLNPPHAMELVKNALRKLKLPCNDVHSNSILHRLNSMSQDNITEIADLQLKFIQFNSQSAS